jgi:hypothetical protein
MKEKSKSLLGIAFAICVAIGFLISDCLGLLIATKLRLLVPCVMVSPLLIGIGCYIVIRKNHLGWGETFTLGVLSLAIVVGNLVFAATAIASV